MFGKGESAHDFVGKMIVVLIGADVLGLFLYVTDNWYEYLYPFHGLEVQWVQITGLIIAWIALSWSLIAQIQMGASWRIGIDTKQKTELVGKGLFKYSRHPIYLGVLAITGSLFFVMPNVLTLVVLFLTWETLSVLARLEEEHMISFHGEEYRKYISQTRRWI